MQELHVSFASNIKLGGAMDFLKGRDLSERSG